MSSPESSSSLPSSSTDGRKHPPQPQQQQQEEEEHGQGVNVRGIQGQHIDGRVRGNDSSVESRRRKRSFASVAAEGNQDEESTACDTQQQHRENVNRSLSLSQSSPKVAGETSSEAGSVASAAGSGTRVDSTVGIETNKGRDKPTAIAGSLQQVLAVSENPATQVLNNNEIMISIFTFLRIKEQAKNKQVSKKWNSLNTQSIEESPKKAFETTKELRKAILAYCNQGGPLHVEGEGTKELPPPTESQRTMVLTVYGEVINDWNVSKLKSFERVFYECHQFDENISSWNTSNAESMSCMFYNASSFNQPLNTWNTSNAENMSCMFAEALSFNQPLDGWNTSKVKDMSYMFFGASSFNQPLNAWNTSKVKDVSYLFSEATSFNQPLNAWNTSNAEDMGCMFAGATSFNQSLNAWNTSNAENMNSMFYNASSFNQPLNAWDISNVRYMRDMFQGASSFNHPIDMWELSSIRHPVNDIFG